MGPRMTQAGAIGITAFDFHDKARIEISAFGMVASRRANRDLNEPALRHSKLDRAGRSAGSIAVHAGVVCVDRLRIDRGIVGRSVRLDICRVEGAGAARGRDPCERR